MRTDPVALAGGAYTDESKPFSMQDTLNMRAQRTEVMGTRSPDKLQTLPGLRPFVEVSGTGSVRGLHNAEERLAAVMGRTLYRISLSGVAVPIGTIPGTDLVQIDHNQISLGSEVLTVNGSAGYLWNTVTNAFGRVTDPGFPGGSWVRFIDGYFVVIEPQGRYAANSAPAQGLEWNTLDRFTSEVSPDPLTSGGVRGNELLLLSTTSGEFFQSTANPQQPFRTKRISFKNVGAPGPHVAIDADGNIFWLGSDGKFYMLDGYSPRRISYRPIEDAIVGLDWSRAFARRWDTVIYWTFPGGKTFGYDYAEREWHRRESYGLGRWRPSTLAWWNDGWIAGDFQRNRLWHCNLKYPDLQDGYWLEGDQEYVVRRTIGVLHDHQNRVRIPRMELVMDTGQRETVPEAFPSQPDPPTITGDAPNGTVGEAYSFSYTLADGTPPYVVTLLSGTLPAGLTLSTAGVLSGTPTTEAAYEWTVRVTDANGLYDDLDDEASFSDVDQFLFHYGGTDGSTTFTDVGNLGIVWTRTAEGGGTLPVISTAQAKFGDSSGRFYQGPGPSVSGWLQGTGVPSFAGGLFTYETWLWISSGTTDDNSGPIDFTDGSSRTGVIINAGSGATRSIGMVIGESLSYTATPPVETWLHVVIQRRAADQWDFFVDGVNEETRTSSYVFVSGGAVPRLGYRFAGHLAETRFIRGAAIYNPAGFTPPVAPFLPPEAP